jgi:hypothetical protein
MHVRWEETISILFTLVTSDKGQLMAIILSLGARTVFLNGSSGITFLTVNKNLQLHILLIYQQNGQKVSR